MAALKVEHTVDLRDVDDGILEQNDVHLLHFRLAVVQLKFGYHVCAQFVEIGYLFVNLSLLIEQEINKNGIACFSCHTVLFVVHLEILFKLII